jgi:hypothetical protein
LTQIPWLDRVLFKNYIAHAIRKAPSLKILDFVAGAIRDRQTIAKTDDNTPVKSREKPDFLAKYIDIADKHPELPPG